MFPRQKQTILGVLGSLLTIVLLYHVLSLNGLYYFRSGSFLDSSELTNYTFLDSLLTQKPVEYNGPNIKTESAYSQAEINHISNSIYFTTPPTSTVLIYFDNNPETLKKQLDAVFRQTSHYSNTVWITCAENQKSSIDEVVSSQFSAFDTMIQLVYTTDTQELWTKLAFQSRTDFIFIFDRQAVPGRSYFDFILRLLHTPAFHSSLLETAPACKDDAEKNFISYNNEINNILVIRRSWISSMIPFLLSQKNDSNLQLNDTIQSQSSLLSQTLNIPTITVPVSKKDLYANTNKENCLESESDAASTLQPVDVLFIADKNDDSLIQLACQFDSTSLAVSVVSLNGLLSENPCKNIQIQFHTIDKVDDEKEEEKEEKKMIELEYWMRRHLPSVIIKVENNKESLLDLVLNRFESAIIINIPAQDIPLTSWMTDLSLSSLKQWNVPNIKLIVTGGGKGDLRQVLDSANKARYLGDNVDITIVLDEQSEKSIRNLAEKLVWKNGQKEIRHRISQVEPMQVFVESWYPSSDHEYAVILDERIELSNVFYTWLKYSLLKYRYSDDNNDVTRAIFGISLYTPRIIDTDPSQRRLFQPTLALHEHGYDTDSPILLQSPYNFGTLYFPEHWREFHDYITARLTDQGIANKKKKIKHLLKDYILTEARSNKWLYSWRKYFDEMMYMRGYVILYPNNRNQVSFSSLSQITRSKNKMKKYPEAAKLFNVPLAVDELPKKQLPKWNELAVFDLWGRMSNIDEILSKGHKLQRKFSACEPLLAEQHKHDPSDMLCPFSQMTEIPIEVDPDTLPTLTIRIPHSTPTLV